jgi:hypothetical protein
LSDDDEAKCPATSKRHHPFSHLLAKIKDHPCPVKTKVRALHAAHDAYALLETMDSTQDFSSVTACRKGKFGGRNGALADYEVTL